MQEVGPIKIDCPKLRKEKRSSKEKFKKFKKAFAAWGESEDDSTDDKTSDQEVANLCLVTKEDDINEECLNAPSNKGRWYLDNECSRHMIEDKFMFASLSSKDGRYVTFRDNSKGKIIGIGNVGKELSPIIENVLFVDVLKHNFLSIS